MHSVIVFFAVAAAVTVHGQQQTSGYENAELIQPAPPALSAEGGDQQAYNSDAFVAPTSPLPPPPPPPPSPPAYSSSAPPASYNTPVSGYATSQPPASYPAPVQGSYASPPPSSYTPPVQGSYGTSPPPVSYPAPLPGSTYGGSTSDTPIVSNGIGYRNRRLFRNRARRVRL